MQGSPTSAICRGRVRSIWVFVASALLYFATMSGSLGTRDATSTLALTYAMMHRWAVDVPQSASDLGWRGTDGRYYVPFGLASAVYNVPFVLAGDLASHLAGGRVARERDSVVKVAVVCSSVVASAVTIALVYAWACRLCGRHRTALVIAALLAFGSPMWVYSKYAFSAPLATAALVAGLYGIWTAVADDRVRPALWGGCGLALAFLTRHELLLAGLVCGAYVMLRSRQRQRFVLLGAMAVTLGPALLLWMAYNVHRFGGAFDSGYTPALDGSGFLAYALSPAAAVWLYAPLSAAGALGLVAMRSRQHGFSWLATTVVLAIFGFYGLLHDWLGTRSYGPRYLVPLLPLVYLGLLPLVELATSRRAVRAALVALSALSILAQVPPVLVHFAAARRASDRVPAISRPLEWSTSPALVTFDAALTVVPRDLEMLVRHSRTRMVMGPATEDAGEGLEGRFGVCLDFWWFYLFRLGVLTGAQAMLLPTGCLLGGAAVSVWLWRRPGLEDPTNAASRARIVSE